MISVMQQLINIFMKNCVDAVSQRINFHEGLLICVKRTRIFSIQNRILESDFMNAKG